MLRLRVRVRGANCMIGFLLLLCCLFFFGFVELISFQINPATAKI